MYDGWAAYDGTARPYLLGNSYGGHACPFNGIAMPADVEAARNETISYAAYRLLSHRFAISPNAAASQAEFDALMAGLGYDINVSSTDYENDGAAALGNYIAQCMIDAGLEDGSNEANNYASTIGYQTVNEPLVVGLPGNPTVTEHDHWQPLVLSFEYDEEGNVVPGPTPGFLSPHWSLVTPFALTDDDLTIETRDGVDYWLYHDPGPPPSYNVEGESGLEFYKWNFVTNIIWSSHLDPNDGVMWDISPAGRGNNPFESYPELPAEYLEFYDLFNGYVTAGQGHDVNPYTGEPYEPEMIPRGDYGRVLAEFWADGPASETPPGHWFTILNEVNDHPALVKKIGGTGDTLSDLEWDVKGYFSLGAAVHDVAVSVWGIKSYYDYIRPVSAIRALAALGQSTDDTLPNYNPNGLPLYDGYIEVVQEGDDLAGESNEHVGKIKIYAWRGPDYIGDPETTAAGVDWILAENWWPYQKPSFITPPFAGYISGHSTFSRAAADILTMFTGDEYFPGGLGEFHFTTNDYLVFEMGPSVDVTLQWATYRDASDETSLSRIWGGIHPPIDDIPGRRVGSTIANQVYEEALRYFNGVATAVDDAPSVDRGFTVDAYPNPVSKSGKFAVRLNAPAREAATLQVFNVLGQEVLTRRIPANEQGIDVDARSFASGLYLLRVTENERSSTRTLTVR